MLKLKGKGAVGEKQKKVLHQNPKDSAFLVFALSLDLRSLCMNNVFRNTLSRTHYILQRLFRAFWVDSITFSQHTNGEGQRRS